MGADFRFLQMNAFLYEKRDRALLVQHHHVCNLCQPMLACLGIAVFSRGGAVVCGRAHGNRAV